MSELSKYIQKQLTTILSKINQTPPKKCASMKKIKNLVNQAPLTEYQKSSINQSIKKIESAMIESNQVKRHNIKSKYVKNLFYQNMILEEKNLNKNNNQKEGQDNQSQNQYNRLLQKLQQIRSTRLKREQYLNELIIKSQKLQRMVKLRQENQEKYLKSKGIQEILQTKKIGQQNMKKQVIKAVRSNKIRSVHAEVLKYNNFIQ